MMREISVNPYNMDMLHLIVKPSVFNVFKTSLVCKFTGQPSAELMPGDMLTISKKYEYEWTGRRLERVV